MLAALALAINALVWPQLNFAGRFKDRTEALYAARSGVEKSIVKIATEKPSAFSALKEGWSRDEDAFRDVKAADAVFSLEGYGLIDEERKININKAAQVVLKNSFVIIGEVDDHDASVIAASIMDWRDPDDKPLENGAETGYYTGLERPYACKNADFQVLDELLQVRGMTPEIFEKMKGYLTVYGLGAVNINTADATVLRCIGLSQALADKIIEYRRGTDGKDSTEDDNVFDNVSTVIATLSKAGKVSSEELSQLSGVISSGRITIRSDNFTGRSVGRAGNSGRSYGITFTFNRNGIVKLWRSD